jgi:two-component system, cell cycle sensor histidine kinase and response regulator CckA
MEFDNPEMPPDFRALRARAEAMPDAAGGKFLDISPEDMARVVNDLHTHRLELELQNEDLRQAQEKLQNAHERLSDLYDFAPVGYITLKDKNLILEANLTLATMLGVRRELLIGQPFNVFIVDEDQDTFYKYLWAVADTAKTLSLELRLRSAEGKPFWAVLESVRVLGDVDGSPPGIRITVADNTEVHHAREISEAIAKERHQLSLHSQQMQKLESLGVMAGGIAHDFNNILAIILGYIDLAEDDMVPGSVAIGYTHEVRIAAERAKELIVQMMAYSGKNTFALEEINLSLMVEEMTQLLLVTRAKKTELICQLDSEIPAIEGAPSQLRQIVMNLITNASEAVGSDGGLIEIMTGASEYTSAMLRRTSAQDALPGGRYAFLKVSDNGCGMDEETQRRIFEPFFTTKFTGRGLGMAAVLGIIRGHQGAISIESEPGCGTNISVLFPVLNRDASPAPEDRTPKNNWLGRGTVLVVDDEAQIRTLLETLLVSKGFSVLTAEDGRQAMDVFRAHEMDIVCVILDLTMPRMGGLETFSELHHIRRDLPVILVSGYGEDSAPAVVSNMGFSGFLQKPIENNALLEKVRSVLAD